MRQHETLLALPRTDHVQRRLAPGPIEGAAENLAINRHDTLNCRDETRHEPLKHRAESGRIEQPKQPAEGVVAGYAVLQLEKAAQRRLFRFRKPRHGNRTLTTAQHRAERDYQQPVEVVQPGIAGERVLQTLPTGDELIQAVLPGNVSATPDERIDLARAGQALIGMSRTFQVRIPCPDHPSGLTQRLILCHRSRIVFTADSPGLVRMIRNPAGLFTRPLLIENSA
jgi:hypothetical protein